LPSASGRTVAQPAGQRSRPSIAADQQGKEEEDEEADEQALRLIEQEFDFEMTLGEGSDGDDLGDGSDGG
jgi:hypothetical protein